jgi:hypothetical protein
MPHKYNADRRHRIPKARYKVTNWSTYEAGLRQRGSPTIWFTARRSQLGEQRHGQHRADKHATRISRSRHR